MPTPFVEKIKQVFKSFIGNINIFILFFQWMFIKQAAVEIGDTPINPFKIIIMLRAVQTTMKQCAQKTFVEYSEKLVFSLLLLSPFQFLPQIIRVKIQKAFFLNEIAEHQSVEHYRYIPLLVAFHFNATNKRQKRCMLFFETGIEVFGYFGCVYFKSSMYADRNIYNSYFLVKFKTQIRQFTE
ncbi:hypothetical protein Barb6XT_01075 [Bacteroidales bacterium Barb6XT]|nr:hypothetical protein Barb6XT_01075 [Bacteroidales bacterium Barb6XT]